MSPSLSRCFCCCVFFFLIARWMFARVSVHIAWNECYFLLASFAVCLWVRCKEERNKTNRCWFLVVAARMCVRCQKESQKESKREIKQAMKTWRANECLQIKSHWILWVCEKDKEIQWLLYFGPNPMGNKSTNTEQRTILTRKTKESHVFCCSRSHELHVNSIDKCIHWLDFTSDTQSATHHIHKRTHTRFSLTQLRPVFYQLAISQPQFLRIERIFLCCCCFST